MTRRLCFQVFWMGVFWLDANAGADAGSDQISRVSVESSSLGSVGYDEQSMALEIEFRDKSVYRYSGVPSEVHRGLIAAESKGHYFVLHIKGKYPFVRISPKTR